MATRNPFDSEDTTDVGADADADAGSDEGWNSSEFDEPTAPGSPIPELATMIAAPLPEMEAEIWQAEIHALVSVSDGTEPSWPAPESWANEARLLRAESELAEGPGEAAGLLLAAARAAEYAGDFDAAGSLIDEALVRVPNAPDALRARARLCEGRAELDDAHALWARLATAAGSADERAYYGLLSAEWTLGRAGKLPAVALDAIPAGPARALAVAEAAIVGGHPVEAAAALIEAGRALAGPIGIALIEQAARFSEAAGDRAAASAERAAARALASHAGEPWGDSGISETSAGVFGRLRDAARLHDRAAVQAFADIAAELPAGTGLARAVTRTAASFARRERDLSRAATLLATLAPDTVATARDRIDVALAMNAPLDQASVERLRAGATSAAGGAVLRWTDAGTRVAAGDVAGAATVLVEGLTAAPDALPLSFQAERLAGELTRARPGEFARTGRPMTSLSADAETTAAALLALCVSADPARRAANALALATIHQGRGSAGAADARAALQIAVDAAPGAALFWAVAAADGRDGRRADAAAALERGAALWQASPLAASLRAAAVGQLAVVDPAEASRRLAAAGDDVATAFGDIASERLASRARGTGDPVAGEAEVRRALSPNDPVALALALLDPETTPTAAVQRLWQADETGDGSVRLYRLVATFVAALASGGDGDEALRRASDLVDAAPGDRAARLALLRAAARVDPERRARIVAELPAAGESDPVLALAVAEALIDAGQAAWAAALLRELVDGPFAAGARRALARTGQAGEAGAGARLPPGLLAGPADETAAAISASLAALTTAAAERRGDAVRAALATQPPHEATPGATTLHIAATLAAAQGDVPAAGTLAAAALRAAGDDPTALPVMALGPLLGDVASSEAALALARRRFGHDGPTPDPTALAMVEAVAARTVSGDDPVAADDRWRAALAAVPDFLPAARALRRAAAGRSEILAAIDATEREAGCLNVPAHRIGALLLAAALAEEAARLDLTSPGGHRQRAIASLRAALAVDSAHDAAFEQLRTLLADAGDEPGLAAALADRIAVAANPFEVTSLRLTRAELLAKLGDSAGARAELDAILGKQPEHPRALARLSELLWDQGAWSETGEVYLRRTVVERDPKALEEVFLRLGHIYRERVPDPKRAVTSYERVRALDPDNRDALAALSELYVAESDPKLAIPVTERLVALETEPARRTAYRVRLGELAMRAGDMRRAGVELRRAVDASPRDLAAVTALAQLLDRARDPAGRKALLDHTVGLLRHDVSRGEMDLGTLRSLSSLLALRERPRAAAAAAQLVAALEASERDAALPEAHRAGRRLHAFRRPEIDERSFPPALIPGVRQLLRIVGPTLRPTGNELGQQLARQGVTRAERVGRGVPPRATFEGLAADLAAGDFDLYLKPTARGAAGVPVRVEPGNPPAIIVGSAIVDLGPGAVRFAAGRTLRLVATNLDVLAAVSVEEAGALLTGVVRQIVPEYEHPAVREALAEVETARAARLIPKKLKQQILPFAMECAGTFDLPALHAAVRDGANAAGLLAADDLPAALAVVLAAAGMGSADRLLTLSPVVAHPEALALLRFAVSDDYDDLAQALEAQDEAR
jgi:tetratricopeptide (TPR) repeat protein